HHATGARLLRFGVAAFNTSGAATKSPDASSDENAGTVKSFTGGVLTLTLADKTEVSGKVTEATRLECESATAPEGGQDDDEQGDDNRGDDDNQGDEQGTSGGDEHSGATATTASNDSGDDDE